jgi:ribosome-associated translation inhibitor RaiA
MMQVPLQIRFHNMASSEAIEARVRERVARLERFSDNII